MYLPEAETELRRKRDNAKFGFIWVILVLASKFTVGMIPYIFSNLVPSVFLIGGLEILISGFVSGFFRSKIESKPWTGIVICVYIWEFVSFAVPFILFDHSVFYFLTLIGLNLLFFIGLAFGLNIKNKAMPILNGFGLALLAGVLLLLLVPYKMTQFHHAEYNSKPRFSVAQANEAAALYGVMKAVPHQVEAFGKTIVFGECWVEGDTSVAYDWGFLHHKAVYGPYYLCFTLKKPERGIEYLSFFVNSEMNRHGDHGKYVFWNDYNPKIYAKGVDLAIGHYGKEATAGVAHWKVKFIEEKR